MTVAQLIKQLGTFPPELDVFVDVKSIDTEFGFDLLCEASKQPVEFRPNPPEKAGSVTLQCVVLKGTDL